jgi:predicted alpha/beta hydrolase family esterase
MLQPPSSPDLELSLAYGGCLRSGDRHWHTKSQSKSDEFQVKRLPRLDLSRTFARWLADQQLLEAALDVAVGVAVTVALSGIVSLFGIVALSGVELAGIESLTGIVVFSSAFWAMLAESIKRIVASIIPINIELFISLILHSFIGN